MPSKLTDAQVAQLDAIGTRITKHLVLQTRGSLYPSRWLQGQLKWQQWDIARDIVRLPFLSDKEKNRLLKPLQLDVKTVLEHGV